MESRKGLQLSAEQLAALFITIVFIAVFGRVVLKGGLGII